MGKGGKKQFAYKLEQLSTDELQSWATAYGLKPQTDAPR